MSHLRPDIIPARGVTSRAKLAMSIVSSHGREQVSTRLQLPVCSCPAVVCRCVGQAVATAAQISLAYALRRPVEQLPISPQSIYYCSQGGKTCLTGWDIQPALLQLVRPCSTGVSSSVRRCIIMPLVAAPQDSYTGFE
jgi:hypothetical protein